MIFYRARQRPTINVLLDKIKYHLQEVQHLLELLLMIN